MRETDSPDGQGKESVTGEELPSRPDSLDELIANMTPEIYQSLRSAVELGKWPDGARLSAQQLEHSMEVIILYEARNLPAEQRTGAPLAQQCESVSEVQTLNFTEHKN